MNHCNVVYLRTRLHVSIISKEPDRSDIHQRCQNTSFTNTENILNNLRRRTFSGEGLTNGVCPSHLLLEELIGSMLTAQVHVFSD